MMDITKHDLMTISQMILIFISGAICAKIQLFKDKDYSDLSTEIDPTDACYNVPRSTVANVYSIITDTCFIAYEQPNCNATISSKYLPGKFLTSESSVGYSSNGGKIESFQICNDKEGGPHLHVDITTYLKNIRPPVNPNILESYHDVCGCVNIPKYVQSMSKWSINNHGNGLFAYFEKDCRVIKSKSLYINAGHWETSRDMHTHRREYRGTTLKIQSFGPARNCSYFQLSCSAYSDDKVMGLELFEAMNHSSLNIDTDFTEASNDLATDADDDVMHFFANSNFHGFHLSSRPTFRCNNFSIPVKRGLKSEVGSIKTKTCLILYSGHDCNGRSLKLDAPGTTNLTIMWESTVSGERTLSLLYTRYPNWKWETNSYHICNQDIGGSNLNVDLYSNERSVESVEAPVILESYNNLCACRNIPKYVQMLENWSIDNHGNSFIAYFSPNCLSSALSLLWIPAGQSSYSLGLSLFKTIDQTTGVVHKIQSIGPDPNSDYFKYHCSRNCTTFPIFGNGNKTGIMARDICDFDTKTECTQIALHIVERMQRHEGKLQVLIDELQNISKQVNLLVSVHQQAEVNLENVQHDLNDKLEKQRDEIQELNDKLNSHVHDYVLT